MVVATAASHGIHNNMMGGYNHHHQHNHNHSSIDNDQNNSNNDMMGLNSLSTMSLNCCSRCCLNHHHNCHTIGGYGNTSSTNLESSNATSGELSGAESLPDIGYFKSHLLDLETTIQSAPARTGEVLLKNFDRNFNSKSRFNLSKGLRFNFLTLYDDFNTLKIRFYHYFLYIFRATRLKFRIRVRVWRFMI